MNSQDQKIAALDVSAMTFADCRLVKVVGRIDHTNSDAFSNRISGDAADVPAGGGMVVDLAELEFITSAGLRALWLAHQTLTAAGARMVVTGIKGVVREVFRISKFDALLTVSETTADAVAQISPAAAEAWSG